ncbi:MAG TPA: hypothetical protein VLF89_09120 [Candidatus Saccharimonadales bacterium]|nr:hypothetical protein [Candidatus Saccharimonadales bacterium]
MNLKPGLSAVVSLLFLFLGYLSSTKGDFATASVFVVIGIIFAVSGYQAKK